MSVLVVSKTSRTFVNTLTPDDNYCLSNKETLLQPIQSELSKKLNIFCQVFTAFLRFTFSPEHFKKKSWASELMYFRNYRRRKTCLCKYLKSHNSVHPRIVNMLKGLNHCWNLDDNRFSGFFCHCERTSVRQCLS